MAWDLATAKIYLKIDPADTSKDAQIEGVMDYVLSSIETALQRGLFFLRQTVRFQYVDVNRLYLPRYPIATVFAIRDGNDNEVEDFTVHSRTGWVQMLRIPASPIEVDFDGGFQILPPDLERAMWEAFMDVWSRTDQDTGGPPESGGTVVQGSGDVKSLTVFDSFKVDYDVGATALSSNTGLAQDQYDWGWLSPWAATLAFYRSEDGTGLGIA